MRQTLRFRPPVRRTTIPFAPHPRKPFAEPCPQHTYSHFGTGNHTVNVIKYNRATIPALRGRHMHSVTTATDRPLPPPGKTLPKNRPAPLSCRAACQPAAAKRHVTSELQCYIPARRSLVTRHAASDSRVADFSSSVTSRYQYGHFSIAAEQLNRYISSKQTPAPNSIVNFCHSSQYNSCHFGDRLQSPQRAPRRGSRIRPTAFLIVTPRD